MRLVDQKSSRDPSPQRTVLGQPAMRYPTPYTWLILFSTLDVMLTKIILEWGGEPGIDSSLEINPIARMVIDSWGMMGASVFKFSLVTLVIIICEVVGNAKQRTGLVLSWTSVAIAAFPVVWSLFFLFQERMTFFE